MHCHRNQSGFLLEDCVDRGFTAGDAATHLVHCHRSAERKGLNGLEFGCWWPPKGKNEMNRRKAITPRNISLLFLTILGISFLATTGGEAREKVYYQATCVTGRGNLPSGAAAPDYCTCAGVTACVGCSSHTCSRWAIIKNEGKKTSTKAQ